MSSTHIIFLPPAEKFRLVVVSLPKDRMKSLVWRLVMGFYLSARLRQILCSTYRLLKLPNDLGIFNLIEGFIYRVIEGWLLWGAQRGLCLAAKNQGTEGWNWSVLGRGW